MSAECAWITVLRSGHASPNGFRFFLWKVQMKMLEMGIRLTHQTPSAGRKVQLEPQPVGAG